MTRTHSTIELIEEMLDCEKSYNVNLRGLQDPEYYRRATFNYIRQFHIILL